MGRDAAIARVAARQFGVFSGRQAVAAGFPRRTIYDRVDRGVWSVRLGDTYSFAGSAWARGQQTVAAYLAVGLPAAAYGETAAAWWQLIDDEPRVPTMLVPWSRRRRIAGLRVKRTRRWAGDVARSGAIHVTTPQRTLLDLARDIDEPVLEIALDAAHRRGLVEIGRLTTYLDRAVASRVSGATRLRSLVRLRDPDGPAGSAAETLLNRVLRRFHVPAPQPQVWVQTRNGRRRIDHAYPDARVAVEVVGFVWHDGRIAFDDDKIRDSELADLGWERRYVTWTLLNDNPAEAAWTVARALGLEPVRWAAG